jgi:hypothetical protein
VTPVEGGRHVDSLVVVPLAVSRDAFVVLVCRCLAACTKPNPAVCCLDEADCASIGVSDPERTCADGLACVDNACVVPSCSTDGCSAEAPVCDITLDVCTGCTGPADCDQFDTKVCDLEGGACVECLLDAECPVTAPICDDKACRACRLDTECASGACGEDGSCVVEQDVVYLDPNGTDSGSCPRETPCKTVQFALTQTTPTRNHIVMKSGSYTGVARVSSMTTSALSIAIHGGGASITRSTGDGEAVLQTEIPTKIRDLTIAIAPFGFGVSAKATTTLERVAIQAPTGIRVQASVVASDIEIEAAGASSGVGISVESGSLQLTRAAISGGTNGIRAVAGSVELSNVLVHDTTKTGIDLTPTGAAVTGSISFVTVTDTGDTTTAPAGLKCGSFFTVRSSILWTVRGTGTPPADACNFISTIAGPVAVAGTTNKDPLFVNPTLDDFHLSSNSPAIDAVDDGPALDFEGDQRPQGTRFDLGADERTR